MAIVKFFKSVKYRGTRYPAHVPFDVRDEDVDALSGAGAVVVVPPEEKESAGGDGYSPAELDLGKMNVAQLIAFAQEQNIDLAGVTKKADILSAIEAHLAESDEETAE